MKYWRTLKWRQPRPDAVASMTGVSASPLKYWILRHSLNNENWDWCYIQGKWCNIYFHPGGIRLSKVWAKGKRMRSSELWVPNVQNIPNFRLKSSSSPRCSKCSPLLVVSTLVSRTDKKTKTCDVVFNSSTFLFYRSYSRETALVPNYYLQYQILVQSCLIQL